VGLNESVPTNVNGSSGRAIKARPTHGCARAAPLGLDLVVRRCRSQPQHCLGSICNTADLWPYGSGWRRCSVLLPQALRALSCLTGAQAKAASTRGVKKFSVTFMGSSPAGPTAARATQNSVVKVESIQQTGAGAAGTDRPDLIETPHFSTGRLLAPGRTADTSERSAATPFVVRGFAASISP
jgi:hypothetical protein